MTLDDPEIRPSSDLTAEMGIPEEILALYQRSHFELNDSGRAERLKTAFPDALIYVPNRGWACWDGCKYAFEEGKAGADQIAGRLSELLEEEAEAVSFVNERVCAGLYRQELPLGDLNWPSNASSTLRDHARRCGNMSARRNALAALESLVSVPGNQLDTAPHLLTLKNGVIDLDAFVRTPAFPRQRRQTPEEMGKWAAAFHRLGRREHRPTKAAGVAYDPTAKCPNWRAFLQLIQPDEQIRHCLQRCLGAMLHGSNEAQVALMFRGGGGNGKSTLLRALEAVLGNYAVPCPVQLFLQGPPAQAGRATPEEMAMPGARLVIASEPGVTDTLSGKAIKAFTGGDKRTARGLHKDPFSYRPGAIPVLQFNRTPRIVEEDEGLRRRLVFLPFDVALHKLPEKSRKTPRQAEASFAGELPGILNWLLEGYRDFTRRLMRGKGQPPGIDPPAQLLALKARILDAADPLGCFIAECTRPEPAGRIPLGDLCTVMGAWSADTGNSVLRSRSIAGLLREKGYGSVKSRGYIHVTGLAWAETEAVVRYRQRLVQPD